MSFFPKAMMCESQPRLVNTTRLPTSHFISHATALAPVRSGRVAIRSLSLKAFGGVRAPRRVFVRLRRDFAVMASEQPVEVQDGKRGKLHGRAFYESIGSPKLVLAPMVEQSEFVCLLALGFLFYCYHPVVSFIITIHLYARD